MNCYGDKLSVKDIWNLIATRRTLPTGAGNEGARSRRRKTVLNKKAEREQLPGPSYLGLARPACWVGRGSARSSSEVHFWFQSGLVAPAGQNGKATPGADQLAVGRTPHEAAGDLPLGVAATGGQGISSLAPTSPLALQTF